MPRRFRERSFCVPSRSDLWFCACQRCRNVTLYRWLLKSGFCRSIRPLVRSKNMGHPVTEPTHPRCEASYQRKKCKIFAFQRKDTARRHYRSLDRIRLFFACIQKSLILLCDRNVPDCDILSPYGGEIVVKKYWNQGVEFSCAMAHSLLKI